jgi:hypothetical protein
MAIVPSSETQVSESSTVRLSMYAQTIQVCECSFWGLRNSQCPDKQGCRDVWVKSQRDEIAYYLAEAQEEIEDQVGYFIGKKWTTGERWKYSTPVVARWGHIVAGGIRAEENIELSSVVDYSGIDPAIVGPIATSVMDINEVKIFHVGTNIEIDPSEIDISGGFVTITIPRCRLVDPSVADNPESGLNYDNVGNFASNIDVKRVYNDTSTQATLIRKKCRNSCDDEITSACIYVRHETISSVHVPSGDMCNCYPDFVELNYLSGIDLTKQAKEAIIRLAHSKMPRNPCDCNQTDEFWKRDRNIPEILDRERLNCPFGISDGAWIAWKWTQSMRLVRGGTM